MLSCIARHISYKLLHWLLRGRLAQLGNFCHSHLMIGFESSRVAVSHRARKPQPSALFSSCTTL